MKHSLYLIISMILLNYNSWGQMNYLSNYSPDLAYDICNDVSDTVFDSTQGFLCQGGSSTLYYSFNTNAAFTWGTPIVISYWANPNFIYTSSSSSYKVYGPFDANEDYATQIATNTAPVLIDAPMITLNLNPSNGWISLRRHIDPIYTISHKKYILAITVPSCSGSISFYPNGMDFICGSLFDCESCLPKFQPVNSQYIVSAWVKEANNPSATTYTNGHLKVTSGTAVSTFYGSGQIIDGWQRIEGIITTDNAGNLKIELKTNAGTVYFDDIRVFPTEGSMITYVYDPVTLRLVAELDERNYAKIYEYDEEGKLIRVKKETEKGVMTIQENRENSHKN